MAVNTYDAVTGRPVFSDNDPPDIKVDPGEAAKYAETVGTRIIGTTTTLGNYAYRRDGLAGYDTTRGCPVVYRGTKVAGAWTREVSFRTFSVSRGGMTDNQVFFQVPTEDTAKDTEPAFSYGYNAPDGKITPEAGVYLIHSRMHPGSAVTGSPTFLQLRSSVAGVGVLDRKTPARNDDPQMIVNALFRTDGTEGFYVEIQKVTAGSHNSSGFLNITKLTTL